MAKPNQSLGRANTSSFSSPLGYVDYAFLSVEPLEVVLVASDRLYAQFLSYRVTGGRLDRNSSSTRIWLPLPRDLKLVRKASKGNVVFEFKKQQSAKEFCKGLKGVGTILFNNVYIGRTNK
jgi:hypothetical protein